MEDVEPVEYGLAVERYLAASGLSEGSRRIYRIALDTWAWALADRTAPTGPARRRARPPVLPLALLDHPDAPARLRAALDHRAADTDPRTLNRELSTLRAASAWWRGRGWIDGDPAAGLRPLPVAQPGIEAGQLTPEQLHALFALRAPLREQALWHLLHESGAAIETVLALDTDDLDPTLRRTRARARSGSSSSSGSGSQQPLLHWQSGTARLLLLLTAGRPTGPLFLTDRRAPAATPTTDRCPHTGRARLSYRRAAELFATHTGPLGEGWTLRQLRQLRPGR
ncbi:hypothetical protein [Kitasatospora sp. NPDC101183]|uniref:hypothetical protein n=1 Tax=Kitasatospora sp. NPDC101183 TaxID=3364100 RepID=UPI003818826B